MLHKALYAAMQANSCRMDKEFSLDTKIAPSYIREWEYSLLRPWHAYIF